MSAPFVYHPQVGNRGIVLVHDFKHVGKILYLSQVISGMGQCNKLQFSTPFTQKQFYNFPVMCHLFLKGVHHPLF